MTGLPDSATLQLASAWLAVAAAIGGLTNLGLGLFTVITGRDHWPRRLLRLRRRSAASDDDLRRDAMTLVLNGAAILVLMMGLAMEIFGARDHSLGEPLITLRFVFSVIAFAGSIACVLGAYAISLTVTYTSRREEPAPD
jgi:hypothetical protein